MTAHTIYLMGDIESPENYIDEFMLLRSCELGDEVTIHINTYGGDYTTALEFIACLESCLAEVKAVVNGYAFSAGALIAVHCNTLTCGPQSGFMFHLPKGSEEGVAGRNLQASLFHKAIEHNLFFEGLIPGLLMLHELESLAAGGDVFIKGEVIERRFPAPFLADET